MTSLLVEHFQAPSGTRDARSLVSARNRILVALAGRTVWLRAGSRTAQRLRSHLSWAVGQGIATAWLGTVAAEDFGAGVHPDDIVFLDDERAADAIRQRGAHVICLPVGPHEPLRSVDAYVIGGRTADGAQIVAALMPCAGIATAKETRGTSYADVGWTSLLADVVGMDREDCVGGTHHARPAIAPR